MWVSSSILDAAIIKDLGKLDGSPKPVPRTTSSRGGGRLPRALGLAGSGPLPLRDERLWVVWKVYDYKEKAGTPWTTNPLGFPEQ